MGLNAQLRILRDQDSSSWVLITHMEPWCSGGSMSKHKLWTVDVPYGETLDELVEHIADWVGAYGGGPEDGSDHPTDCKCRICFTGMLRIRIDNARNT